MSQTGFDFSGEGAALAQGLTRWVLTNCGHVHPIATDEWFIEVQKAKGTFARLDGQGFGCRVCQRGCRRVAWIFLPPDPAERGFPWGAPLEVDALVAAQPGLLEWAEVEGVRVP